MINKDTLRTNVNSSPANTEITLAVELGQHSDSIEELQRQANEFFGYKNHEHVTVSSFAGV